MARFPNRFQRQCLGDVRAVYAIRQDRRLDVVNRCRTNDGVTEADRKYLWILGRSSSIETEAFAAALEAARSNGFDVARLIRTEQIGPAR